MRILLHDYCGHPFQVQLSRHLAQAGHEVLHLYFDDFQTPHGAVERQADDVASFAIRGISLNKPFAKYNFIKRWRQEISYGRKVAEIVTDWRPEVVLSANMPLDPQAVLMRACARTETPFVLWLQDIHSLAIARFFSAKLPVIGKLIGWRYYRLERRLLAASDHIVCICDDFAHTLARWGIDRRKLTVIENWAPLPKDHPDKANPWSRSLGLDDKFVFLYSGTLGIKHNPALLLRLAERFADRPKVRVVVASEGLGADWLNASGVRNLLVVPFVAHERYGEALASADVLVALLGSDAGVYSVPSKVLTYFGAGRPVLAAIPKENLAARLVERNAAGLVSNPDDVAAFCQHAELLWTDTAYRQRLGRNGLAYAQRTFQINRVTDRFAAVCETVLARGTA